MQACYDLNRREEFDSHAYYQIDNELCAHEQYSDENVGVSSSEEQVEEEEEQDSAPPRQISKLQATESLNMLREYLLNSDEDCKIQSIVQDRSHNHQQASPKTNQYSPIF